MKTILKYLGEAVVIIFSVLIAFLFEEYRASKEEAKNVAEAISALQSEVHENYERLKVNYDFFANISAAMELVEHYSNDEGLLIIDPFVLDSVTNASKQSFDIELIDCHNENQCKYRINIEFNYIPDFAIQNNIWESINSSQIASKIDIQLMATASNFYKSWSHHLLESEITDYNKQIISSTGESYEIPSFEVFIRLTQLHRLSLSKYDENLDSLEMKIRSHL